MGITTKTHNLSQYATLKELPHDFLEKVADRIRYHSFLEIEPDSNIEKSMGWVDFGNMLDTEFSTVNFLKEPYIALGLRVDKRSVSASTLTRYCLEEENKIKKQEEIDFISKKRSKEIKEATKLRLLKLIIPATQVYDMIWNYSTGQVFFTNISPKLCDEFSELFHSTFDQHLMIHELSLLGSEYLKEKDFSDIVHKEFKYLDNAGASFLNWLWNEALGNGASFNGIDIFFDGRVVLNNEDVDSKEVVTCVGDSQSMGEIITAIDNGKKITEAKLLMVTDSGEWAFTLDSAYFDFKALKTPKISMPSKEDPNGFFYEKVYLLEEISKVLDTIFKLFVADYGKLKLKGEK